MEPKFKAQFNVTKELLKSLSFFMYFLRPIRIVLNVLFLLYFANAVYVFFAYYYYVTFGLWFIPLVWAFEVYAYFRSINLSMKRYKETHNENSNATYEFFDDHFESTATTGTEYNVDYSSIVKFTNNKKLVFLRSKARLIYWIPINSLEGGDLDEFKAFLKTKGIKVK